MKWSHRWLFLAALLLLPLAAGRASAQYMFLDANGDGLYDPAVDKMNANGVATTVDVYVITDKNRDGSTAICDSDDDNGNPPGFTPLTINSYAFNLRAVNGTVTYSGYINRDPVNMPTPFGEINLDGVNYKNGFGGLLTQNPGKYRLATLTITGVTGTPSIQFVDQIAGSNDFTAFGTRCDGNGFDSTYKLDGPVTQSIQGAGDWFDADGLPSGGGPVNTAPVLAAIGNKTIAEGSLLSFTATATDPDAGQTLTFSLSAGAPAGAAITSGGAFTWTPTEAQGPNIYTVTVNVTDGTDTDSETIDIQVSEVNQAPVLAPIGDKTAQVGVQLAFTATATDADLPAQTLTFTLGAGAPAGSSISPTGSFTWTPTSSGSFPITINVSDGTATDSETITVAVSAAANTPPTLAAIGDKSVNEGSLLSFTATATDPDAGQTLTFTLSAGSPAGAAITSGGAFTWTPTEAQGPGVYPITINVSDGTATDSETIQVTVNEVNEAPVLSPIGDQNGAVGNEVTFDANATDADIPANTLTFSLDAGAPAGATIDASTGVFSWTPGSSGAFPVTVRVTDNGTPQLFDTETITINVAAGGAPPVLAAIGNQTVNEGSLLAFTASATDANNDPVTFSLGAGAPAGAAITSGGSFTWTPTEAQGPGVYSITVIASDGTLQDSETIDVTVNEINVAPVLDAISDQTVDEGSLLSFTATATDPDLPANTLTFTLDAGAPAGAAITTGGAFTWTPAEDQGPGVYPITVTVSDGKASASTRTSSWQLACC